MPANVKCDRRMYDRTRSDCETWMPTVATKPKISKSYILTPPPPQGHRVSVKCEQPIYELTVQVWLLYHLPNFKYCTLCVSWTKLRTDRRTDDSITAPTDFSGQGLKKLIHSGTLLWWCHKNLYFVKFDNRYCKPSFVRGLLLSHFLYQIPIHRVLFSRETCICVKCM